MAGFDALLDAARAGDGRAFDELLRLWNGRLSGFVRARGVQDVDGVVNDVFLKAFVALGSFSGDEDAFRAWLFRIARNRTIDEFRRLGRTVVTVELGEAETTVGGDVVADVEDRMGSDRVVALLGLLTDEQREVLALRFVADLTIDQIAEVTGRRRGAVKQLQRRGLRRLEAILET
jgi:RNA polymerase sigma-70 factor (ECF subfamily)